MTIEAAIAESVARNTIVTLDHTPEAAEALQALCDDSVDTGEVEEFWGVDDDGDDWRVHLRRESR